MLNDSRQIKLTILFSLLHNVSNVYEYIQVLIQTSTSITTFSYINFQIMLGRYPLLEKGPLTALLGGEVLFADPSLQSNKSGKFRVLAVMCRWYDL